MTTISHYRAQCADRKIIDALLMHVLQYSREKLLASLQDPISTSDEKKIKKLLSRYKKGEPLAYLIGTQAFWSMELIVTPDVLIPRPDTECLIAWILSWFVAAPTEARPGRASATTTVADLGTGTGAIAIALARENPDWQIDAIDHSSEALSITKKNAEKYSCTQIQFIKSDWFSALQQKKYNLIVSNPPYIAKNDPHLSELQHEPQAALVSGTTGLDAIQHIVSHAKNYLAQEGVLVIEHGYTQATSVTALFQEAGFKQITSHRDLADRPRFVTGIA